MNKYSNNIDMIITNKELNILKSIFPLLPANAKKGLAVYIAINELTTALSILKLIGITIISTPHQQENLILARYLKFLKLI